MPSLEHVVRPVVIADFRPRPQTLPIDPNAEPEDFKLSGGGGTEIEETASYSTSTNYSIKHKERKRIFDNVKVMNPDDHEQHVTVEVPTEIQNKTYSGGFQPSKQKSTYTPQEVADNIQILNTNNIRTTSGHTQILE